MTARLGAFRPSKLDTRKVRDFSKGITVFRVHQVQYRGDHSHFQGRTGEPARDDPREL